MMRRALHTRSTSHGFTLAESLLAAVVLAIAVIAVAATFSASHAQSSAVQAKSAAVAMATQLMEEIAAKPLVETNTTAGWPTETNRVKFDSVRDYDGYTDSTPLHTLESEQVEVTQLPFTRKVKLHYPATLFGTTPAAGDLVLVEVNVSDSTGNGCVLHRLFGRTTLQR
jgi:Tfp pilus assembly protein PilV